MRALAVAGLALALAACGGDGFSGDAKASYDMCVGGGGEPAYCSCVTKDLQTRMTPEVFAKMAKAEMGEDEMNAVLDEIAAADAACAAEKKPAA